MKNKGPEIVDVKVTYKTEMNKEVVFEQMSLRLPKRHLEIGECFNYSFMAEIESMNLLKNNNKPIIYDVKYESKDYGDSIGPIPKKSIDGLWKELLSEEFSKTYFQEIKERVSNDRSIVNVYPQSTELFEAFKQCSFEETKIVIIGQDPYHTSGIADGMAFSSKKPGYVPPSLSVIMDEVFSDYCAGNKEVFSFNSPSLIQWALQGVLLLNSALTVKEAMPRSHSNIGWEHFIKSVFKQLMKKDNVVWILWGNDAQNLYDSFDKSNESTLFENPEPNRFNKNHLVLRAAHPAAEIHNKGKAGFYGCKHFTQTNEYLIKNHLPPVRWCIY